MLLQPGPHHLLLCSSHAHPSHRLLPPERTGSNGTTNPPLSLPFVLAAGVFFIPLLSFWLKEIKVCALTAECNCRCFRLTWDLVLGQWGHSGNTSLVPASWGCSLAHSRRGWGCLSRISPPLSPLYFCHHEPRTGKGGEGRLSHALSSAPSAPEGPGTAPVAQKPRAPWGYLPHPNSASSCLGPAQR